MHSKQIFLGDRVLQERTPLDRLHLIEVTKGTPGTKGVARVEMGTPRSRKMLQKNRVISEGSVFSDIFAKYLKIQYFYKIFINNFHSFSTICFCRPCARPTHGF